MRVLKVAFKLAVATVAAAAMCSPMSAAVATPARSIAGSWKGPFLGTIFTFEFNQSGDGWTGRWQSERYGKWVDLHDLSFTDGTVSFSFKSQPPSTYTLKLDAEGKALNGSVQIGAHPPLPLTLIRSS